MSGEGMWVSCSPNPWNRLLPQLGPYSDPYVIAYELWQGGQVFGPQAQPCAPGGEFDIVVNMAGRGEYGARVTDPDVIQENFWIPDSELGPGEMALVDEAVQIVLDGLNDGYRVLVRCHMGWNRSGLVAGLVLRSLGWDAEEAIALIRTRRDPNALCNEHFVRYIHEHPGR